MAYHLTNVHGLQKGSPSKKQKRIVSSHFITNKAATINDKEQICLCWAANGLAYEVIEDPNFKVAFKASIPLGLDRKELSAQMLLLAERMRGILSKKIQGQAVTLALDGGTIHKKLQSSPVNLSTSKASRSCGTILKPSFKLWTMQAP